MNCHQSSVSVIGHMNLFKRRRFRSRVPLCSPMFAGRLAPTQQQRMHANFTVISIHILLVNEVANIQALHRDSRPHLLGDVGTITHNK
eukprot:scaffold4867_cov136-Skeletonema_dohrnii-CCMP3373.AAC.1